MDLATLFASNRATAADHTPQRTTALVTVDPMGDVVHARSVAGPFHWLIAGHVRELSTFVP